MLTSQKTIALIIILIPFKFITGQNMHDHQWILENYISIDFRNPSPEISLITPNEFIGTGSFTISMSNQEGDLAFYSGGCYVLNTENEIIINGDSINSDFAHSIFCGSNYFPIPQSITAIPLPQSPNRYMIFNLDLENLSESNILPAPQHLFAHTVDMSLDDGFGEITNRKQIVIQDTLARGYIQATKHSNNSDWWIITPEWNSNCYYVTLVDSMGIGETTKQCLGPIWNDLDGGGQAAFSPDGSRYSRIEAINGFFIADFDKNSGHLSNATELTYPQDDDYFRGTVFSHNSQYLYVSASLQVFQFDLMSIDVQNSIQLVGEIDPSTLEAGQGSLYLSQLAPDGNIYIASPGAHRFLSVINKPNCPGIMSSFEAHTIELPASNFGGLPNLPQFDIVDIEYDCTTSTTDLLGDVTNIFPNPTFGEISIESEGLFDINITDIEGRSVMTVADINQELKININSLPNGIYILKIRRANHITTERIIKM